ncbi:hypothetical protein NQ315_001700 [Exocentrus adspersus]|uniref:EF-hand domain-containing protein n=1 Tax=Exocentrus adspersus TaxID=1586481 RepID=A0AAV8W950_9CUCU|nr:hypothetical protein NQ315_001700 [Exocentrus adspersus]
MSKTSSVDNPAKSDQGSLLEVLEESGEEEANSEPCLCSFFQMDYKQTTLEEYKQKHLKEEPLFSDILTLEKEEVCIEKPSKDPNESILVTGFGIRNLKSLQDALKLDERKRLYELYKIRKTDSARESSTTSSSVKDAVSPVPSSKRSIQTETDTASTASSVSTQQQKLRYLMGLEQEKVEEEESYPLEQDLVREMLMKQSEDNFLFSDKTSTKAAQSYLRTHRIFDFFQFIITHLLSAAPENPITFILVLLNKILLYRSGTGHPPLLYQRKHIEQLFSLMDRMNTGSIDMEQYESGMKTLGICEYNKNPKQAEEGLVTKKVFVQEALESETALFNDLIKRKWAGQKPKDEKLFSGPATPIRSYISGATFIPSDLLPRSTKHYPSAELVAEPEEG